MEVSLKELKEWQDKMYSLIHNFERLNTLIVGWAIL